MSTRPVTERATSTAKTATKRSVSLPKPRKSARMTPAQARAGRECLRLFASDVHVSKDEMTAILADIDG